MSEEVVGYREDRVLLIAARILAPQFAAMGIYLTGAQVEMLRNVTMYLGRRTTYVDTYYYGSYTMPDDSDWDTILAIVSNLEDKLMANENTPFGFKERWVDVLEDMLVGDGTAAMTLDPVSEGEVLRLEGVSWYNNTGARGRMQIYVKTGTQRTNLADIQSPTIREPVMWTGVLSLAEGDKIVVTQSGCLDGDVHIGAARGYKMEVPG